MKAPRPRGKFLGGGPPGGADAASSGKAVPAAAAPTKPKRTRTFIERQAKLFADLDKAESLTLDLLSLAASTAQTLSDALVAGTNDKDEWFTQCEANGQEYMHKVKQIHALLFPHAHLVVPYKNPAVDAEVTQQQQQQLAGATSGKAPSVSDADARGKEEEEHGKKRKRESSEGGNDKPTPTKEPSPVAEDDKAAPPRNMYAARVELRLAVERREVLREMLRLEKQQQEKLRESY